MSIPAAASQTFSLFSPPYEELEPCTPEMVRSLRDVDEWKGKAVVWQLTSSAEVRLDFDTLRDKTPGLPLLVLLPPASDIHSVLHMLPMIRTLNPRMILPHGLLDVTCRIRDVFTLPPRSISNVVTDYLMRRGNLRTGRAVKEFKRILELAPEVTSISVLSRRVYASRRTLGRHSLESGLPVPSHCLGFARLLHATILLQSDQRTTVARIATRLKYPDGFTMSNQMKRLIGSRPSDVRELLGWEWVVDAWLKREGMA